MTAMTTDTLPAILTTPATDENQQKVEWLACSRSPLYFVHRYVYIYNAIASAWIPFRLWPAQARALKQIHLSRLIILLKARQIGMTWLVLAFALWLMLFHPAATVLLFSRRDDEAIDLLDFRLKGMYQRLPPWMQAQAVVVDNAHEWALSNGSRAIAFPTTGGDSYTATLAIADEYDLIPDQDQVMRSVKPTIDNGGRFIILSRPDKDRPDTRFKRIYKAARQHLNDWGAIFLPWYAHPGRDRAWYEAQQADILSSTGSTDELYEQYPETEEQALAARALNKRFPPQWLQQCYAPEEPLFLVGETPAEALPPDVPAIPGLRLYRLPEPGRRYVMGADPAEGLSSSDDSSLTVGDAATGEQVAKLSGKFEPKVTFPQYIDQVGRFYNQAAALVERNNHGHAVIGYLQTQTETLVMDGFDGRPGWLNNTTGKVRLYDDGASSFMHQSTLIHDRTSYAQLESIEKDTLRAPKSMHDDDADSYLLMLEAAACGLTIGIW